MCTNMPAREPEPAIRESPAGSEAGPRMRYRIRTPVFGQRMRLSAPCGDMPDSDAGVLEKRLLESIKKPRLHRLGARGKHDDVLGNLMRLRVEWNAEGIGGRSPRILDYAVQPPQQLDALGGKRATASVVSPDPPLGERRREQILGPLDHTQCLSVLHPQLVGRG